jgi:hypothetical protein
MERGMSPSLPDTRRIDDYKKQIDENSGQLSVLAKTVRFMFEMETTEG